MYTVIHIISMVVSVIFNTYYGYKLGLTKSKAALSSTVSLALLYITMILIPWVESGFKVFGGQNMVKTYVFAPIIFVIVSAIFKIDFRKVSDMHAVWPMLLHGISHFACLIPNCCEGYCYVEGTKMYEISQALTGTNMFPNQICESVAALIIGAIMFFIAYKKNFKLNGRLFYVMVIVYGINRFCWEFLRDNNKIIVFGEMTNAESGNFGLSDLSFYAIAMIVMGTAFLVAFHIKDKKAKAAEAVTV